MRSIDNFLTNNFVCQISASVSVFVFVSVRCCNSIVHCTRPFLQGARNKRPCITGHPVFGHAVDLMLPDHEIISVKLSDPALLLSLFLSIFPVKL